MFQKSKNHTIKLTKEDAFYETISQFQNTTKVYFGQNQLQHLHEEVLKYGDKVLIAHGGDFIQNSPLYSRVMLKRARIA